MELGPLSRIPVMYKLIGSFLILSVLTVGVGYIGIMGINNLDGQLSSIVDNNVQQADASMETIVALKTQIIDIHSYMLGEKNSQTEFNNQIPKINMEITLLKDQLHGTSQESPVTNIESEINSFISVVNNSKNGLFVSKDSADAANTQADAIYWKLDSMQETLDNNLQLLEDNVIQYAQQHGITANETLKDNAMELNLLVWRMGDKARVYIKTDLNNDTTSVNTRLEAMTEYADMVSIQNSASVPQTGLERDFYDLCTTSIKDYSQAFTAGQVNSTPLTILSQVRDLVFFNASDQSFSHIIRDTQDGIFVHYDNLIVATLQQQDVMSQADAIQATLTGHLNTLEIWVNNGMTTAVANAESVKSSSLNITMLIMGAVVVSSILLGLLITFHLVPPITKIQKVAEEVANGNLKVDTSTLVQNRKDEIGKVSTSFSVMIDKVIANILNTVETITTVSAALASSAQELSSSSEEVNASSEEISSISQQMAKGAIEQSAKIHGATESAIDLKQTFSEKMNQINQTADLIDQISSQVNMLALNASIEAARAGEYGRGFAVVADNIRRLAEDSNSSVVRVQETVDSLRKELSHSIDNIISSVEQVSPVAEETASGAEEASAATEEQAATMQELTASAQELSEMANKLENSLTMLVGI